MSEKRLTGRIARENIRLMQVPRPPQGVIEGFRALGDATGIVSDVMGGSPEDFARFLQQEIERLSAVIRRANIQLD